MGTQNELVQRLEDGYNSSVKGRKSWRILSVKIMISSIMTAAKNG